MNPAYPRYHEPCGWQRLLPPRHPQPALCGDGSPERNSGVMLEIALADDADPGAVSRMAQCNPLIAGAMADPNVLLVLRGLNAIGFNFIGG